MVPVLAGSLDACTEVGAVKELGIENATILFSDTASDAEDKVLLIYYELAAYE